MLGSPSPGSWPESALRSYADVCGQDACEITSDTFTYARRIDYRHYSVLSKKG
jgi:hypothetical protein